MEACHKVAVDLLRLAAEHGDYKPTTAGEVTQQVKQVSAALFGQIEEVSK
jgi:hypothetical protein